IHIGRIAWARDRDPGARPEGSVEGKHKACGRAHGDKHALGIEVHIMLCGIVAGESLPQLNEPLGAGISLRLWERGAHRVDHSRSRWLTRLAQLKMADAAS